MTRLDHIKKLYRNEKDPLDEIWQYCRAGKGKVERYKRFKAAQQFAQGMRKAAENAKEREAWNNRRKAYRSRKRRLFVRINDQPALGTGPNEGSTSIVEAVVVNVFVQHGIPVTSRKRWETFGNPSSDHWLGNTDADAADGGIAEAYWLHEKMYEQFKKMRIPLDRMPVDFLACYCRTGNGRQYRYQGIAQTHGTGPHYHGGVKHE